MIRVGLFGTGFMGETHAAAYQNIEGVELAGVYTRSADKGQAFAERFGTRYYADPAALLSAVDVADICLPTHLHEAFIVQAAQAGKDILCEKPVAISRPSLQRIRDAVEANGVRFMPAHVLRFWPEYDQVKRWVDAGEVGDVLHVSMARLAQPPVWSDWFRDPDKSGGALFDSQIHDIDMALYLLGPIDRVYAVGTRSNGCWDHVVTTLIARSGAKAVCENSYMMPSGYPFTMSIRVVGTEGGAEFVLRAGFNLENRQESHTELVLYKGGPAPAKASGADAYEAEIRYFLDSLRSGAGPDRVRMADVFACLEVQLAAEESLRTGQAVSIPTSG